MNRRSLPKLLPALGLLLFLLAILGLSGLPALAAEEARTGQAMAHGIHIMIMIAATIAFLGVGMCVLLVVQLVFPNLSRAGVEGLRERFMRSFLFGIVVVVVCTLLLALAGAIAQQLAGLLFIVFASL